MQSAMEVTEDEIYARWVRWMDTIARETIGLFGFRDYWRGLAQMTQANPDIPPSTIFNVLAIWYGSAMMIGIRRQTDRRNDSVSLWRLLTEMAQRPNVITRSRHVAVWVRDGYDADWRSREGDKSFTTFAGEGAETIPPDRTFADRQRLWDVAEPIIRHVNKRLAHREEDERALPAVPTYGEINRAVDLVGELLNRYQLLLKASTWHPLEPVHHEDWTQAFTVAWKKPVVPRH
jgi:hypothetical protein